MQLSSPSQLDTLLYQLHTLSFFLSPSLLLYFCRIIAQFLCYKPRELDSQRSLSFFYATTVLLNLPSMWSHSTRGPAEGRALVLDFVGLCAFPISDFSVLLSHRCLAYSPSKLQLCCLDLFILCFQLLLTTIAYETSIYYSTDDPHAEGLALPHTSTFSIPSPNDGFTDSFFSSSQIKQATWSTNPLPLVMDLRFRSVLNHLRNSPRSLRTTQHESVLPLPNTTPFILPGMRMLLRAGRHVRNDQPSGVPRRTREMRIPGAIESTLDR